MHCTKKVIGNLYQCYSLLKLNYNNKDHLLVASEKNDKCLMFDMDGNYEEIIWEGPGGVMGMEQVPDSNGQFIAIQRFYSPNNAEKARLVVVTPKARNNWEVKVLTDLPFVHRIGIIKQDEVNYLIAATVKSAHAFDEDWTCPGRVWAAELPKDLSDFNENNQLQMKAIVSGLFRNHGFCKIKAQTVESVLIGADNGIIKLTPPNVKGGEWLQEILISEPTSDMIMLDFDEDGEDELLTLSPFHGETLSIYKKVQNQYKKIYTHPKSLEFLHAIWGGFLSGVPTAIIGYRGGNQELLSIRCNDKNKPSFSVEVLDAHVGPANLLHYVYEGVDCFLSSNREIDEIAIYSLKL